MSREDVRAAIRGALHGKSYLIAPGDYRHYRGPDMEPSACRWCGMNRRWHGRAYFEGVGVHVWTPPTKEQTLYRMLRRRYDTQRWWHR